MFTSVSPLALKALLPALLASDVAAAMSIISWKRPWCVCKPNYWLLLSFLENRILFHYSRAGDQVCACLSAFEAADVAKPIQVL